VISRSVGIRDPEDGDLSRSSSRTALGLGGLAPDTHGRTFLRRLQFITVTVWIQCSLLILVAAVGCGRSVEGDTGSGGQPKEAHSVSQFDVFRVAHAGGGVDGQTYTNSYEALNSNIEKGYKYFELDFSLTEDEEIVCLHDWQHSFERTFGVESSGKVTLAEFELLVRDQSTFTKCTLDGLALWLEEKPDAIIVTDAKEGNIQVLRKIRETIKEAGKRVIPQVYQPEDYSVVKRMGYEQIIWTLYRYQGGDDQVLAWVDEFQGPFAVTMPKKRALTSLPKRLRERGIPSYVHTVNSQEEMQEFQTQYGISEIYTDFLSP